MTIIAGAGRLCSKCSTVQPLSNFYQISDPRSDGYYAYCKTCASGATRATVLRLRYGISVEQYDKMLADQNGLCAICKQPPGRRRLCVDHDHKTGKIRSLLCANCNGMLGRAGDSVEWFEQVIAYLRRS